ncbi:unnamed protein product [Caenorhabditis brenneri]
MNVVPLDAYVSPSSMHYERMAGPMRFGATETISGGSDESELRDNQIVRDPARERKENCGVPVVSKERRRRMERKGLFHRCCCLPLPGEEEATKRRTSSGETQEDSS